MTAGSSRFATSLICVAMLGTCSTAAPLGEENTRRIAPSVSSTLRADSLITQSKCDIDTLDPLWTAVLDCASFGPKARAARQLLPENLPIGLRGELDHVPKAHEARLRGCNKSREGSGCAGSPMPQDARNGAVGQTDLLGVSTRVRVAQSIERFLHQRLLIMDEVQRIAFHTPGHIQAATAYQLGAGHIDSLERTAQSDHEGGRAVGQHPRHYRCRGEEVGPRADGRMGIQAPVALRA